MSVETIKAESLGLRSTVAIELQEPTPHFSDDVWQILKFHGIYQQHDRDVRGRNNRVYSFMVRSKLPGGRLTAQQYLVQDALADQFGQGDLRFTTRQGIQLHGVIKGNLQATIKSLNDVLITTLGACGDVSRNVMSCPAPYGDAVRAQLQATAEALAQHLAPRTNAYHEIWLEGDDGKKTLQHFESNGTANGSANGTVAVEEPIYGKTYLPRKFKIALAYPGDNCTDIFSNDIGLVGLFDEGSDHLHGFNVYVGGGLGATHNNADTFPLLAQPLGYVSADKIIDVAEKIVLVQRDYGDRADRKHARMKYLVHEWGIAKFRAKVEEYLGYTVDELRPMPELEVDDHLGWQQQVDGKWFYGIFIENGRVRDSDDRRIRSGLRTLVERYRPGVYITPQQNILLSGFNTEQKAEVEQLLADYGIVPVEQLTLVRRHSLACPALPSCGLAVAEAERFLPNVIDQLEKDVADLGLSDEFFTVRMTGCPNGCARPYVADIGMVGRTLGKYTLYLGGNPEGTRLNTLYQDLIPADDLPGVIRQVLLVYRQTRHEGERVGDWANRVGVDLIRELSSSLTAAYGGTLVNERDRHTLTEQVMNASLTQAASPATSPVGFLDWTRVVFARLSNRFDAAATTDLLRWSIQTFGNGLTLGTSFGASGIVLMDLALHIQPDVDIFYIDTGYFFPETHQLITQLENHYQRTFRRVSTQLTFQEQDKRYGPNLYQNDPDLCCHLRKVSPMKQALADSTAWVSALRHDQAATRKEVPMVQWNERYNIVKIAPLIHWAEADIWQYIHEHALPYNELHDRNYPSIGCWPCTKAVQAGDDLRAGRWQGSNKVECGLHWELVTR